MHLLIRFLYWLAGPVHPGLRFEIFQDSQGQWRWHIRSRNHETVATSGEAFSSESNARRAAKMIRDGMYAQIPLWTVNEGS